MQYSICNTLRIQKQALQAELARLPKATTSSAEVDLAKMYSRLLAGRGSTASSKAGSSVPQYQSIFDWCVSYMFSNLHHMSPVFFTTAATIQSFFRKNWPSRCSCDVPARTDALLLQV